MKVELTSAANFLVHLLRLGRCQLGEPTLEKFRTALVEVLKRRYRDHWFPEKPFKGSGYRCLRINGKLDPVLCQAADAVAVAQNALHSAFPSELTMWIDPLEVSYRIGENGSICVLYAANSSGNGANGNSNSNEPWKPSNQQLRGRSSPSSPAPKENNVNETNLCKNSMRRMDYLLDPRQSAATMEHLAAYVSS